MNTTHTFHPNVRRGISTAIRVINGRLVSLDAHVARLSRSISALYNIDDLDPSLVTKTLRTAAIGIADTNILRVAAVPCDGSVSFDCQVLERLLPEPLHLRTCAFEHWSCNHKTIDRPDFARGSTLIVDTSRRVLEVDNGNFFALFDDTLVTPPTHDVLPGVGRATIIDVAEEIGMDVEVRNIALDECRNADALFSTNALRGIMHIVAIDDTAFPADTSPWVNKLAATADAQNWEISAESWARHSSAKIVVPPVL